MINKGNMSSPCIPAAQDTPRYSISVPIANSSRAPLPATRLSPMAPTTSMSPGRSLWTLVGLTALLPSPGDVMFLHGNGIDPGNDGCLLMPVGPGVMTMSSLTAGVCESITCKRTVSVYVTRLYRGRGYHSHGPAIDPVRQQLLVGHPLCGGPRGRAKQY